MSKKISNPPASFPKPPAPNGPYGLPTNYCIWCNKSHKLPCKKTGELRLT